VLPIDHAAACELVSAVRDLNAVASVLLETANTFDECAGALRDRDPVALFCNRKITATASKLNPDLRTSAASGDSSPPRDTASTRRAAAAARSPVGR
jgi:hypothetical protein